MNRSDRLHAIGEALRRAGGRGRTADSLAAEFEVSTRTVKRDLASLMTQGLPMRARTGPGGGYVLDERGSLPPVNLNAAQAVALSAAVAASAGAPFGDAARAATRKVLDVVDPATRSRARALAKRVWVDVGPGAPRRIMTSLEGALAEQVTVNLTYEDATGRVTRREIEPMIFALVGGRWYVVAWCRVRRGVRWFRLERVRGAVATRTACPQRSVSIIGTPPPSAGAVEA